MTLTTAHSSRDDTATCHSRPAGIGRAESLPRGEGDLLRGQPFSTTTVRERTAKTPHAVHASLHSRLTALNRQSAIVNRQSHSAPRTASTSASNAAVAASASTRPNASITAFDVSAPMLTSFVASESS